MLKKVGARKEVITCRGWGLGGFLLSNVETGGGKERGNYL